MNPWNLYLVCNLFLSFWGHKGDTRGLIFRKYIHQHMAEIIFIIFIWIGSSSQFMRWMNLLTGIKTFQSLFFDPWKPGEAQIEGLKAVRWSRLRILESHPWPLHKEHLPYSPPISEQLHHLSPEWLKKRFQQHYTQWLTNFEKSYNCSSSKQRHGSLTPPPTSLLTIDTTITKTFYF